MTTEYNFKKGDRVMIQVGPHHQTYWTRHLVERTTRTKIVLDNGSEFRQGTGRQFGSSSAWSTTQYIKPFDKEVYDASQREVKLRNSRYHLTCLDRRAVETLTQDQLDGIRSLLAHAGLTYNKTSHKWERKNAET